MAFFSLTTLSFNQLQSIVNFEQDGQETLQRGKHAQQGGPRLLLVSVVETFFCWRRKLVYLESEI